jgi:hypothetical protein
MVVDAEVIRLQQYRANITYGDKKAMSIHSRTRILSVLTLAAMLALPVGALTATGASAALARGSLAQQPCKVLGYKRAKCVVVPQHGTFSITVLGTKVKLIGNGSPATAGTDIIVAEVSQPCPGRHGVGFRVVTTGPMPRLHLQKGMLYKFDPATGKCNSVRFVTGPGIYEAVGAQ